MISMADIIYLKKGHKSHSILFFITSAMFEGYFIYKVWMNQVDTIAVLYGVIGIIHLIYGLDRLKIGRIEINSDYILSKRSILASKKIINWEDIKEISFGSYRIDLALTQKREERIRINTDDSSISISVKEAIATVAGKKEIPVNPG